MPDIDEERNTINVTYYMWQYQSLPYVNTITVDISEIQKFILLELYNSEVFKVKVYSSYLTNIVSQYIYAMCYKDSSPRRNTIYITNVDLYKPITLLFAKGLIDSTEENNSTYFALTESGKEMCKKYLLEQ
ncbi:MAG: hypothetical protein ACI4CX_05250 [Candidatus Weimeria sp.]